MRISQFSAWAMVTILATCLVTPAYASPILTPSFQTQLETWLGQGPLTFTSIYKKQTGDTATTNFHPAVDGKGPTFTLMDVTANYNDQTHVIGGYDPLSWSSIGGYNVALLDSQRTAFIYNLTTGVERTERLTSDLYNPTPGQYQTYNNVAYGPTFGGGFDIGIFNNLNIGDAEQWSYGNGGPCGVGGTNILGFSFYMTPCFTYIGNDNAFTVGALEVYTFAPATAVPEPISLALLGTGLSGMLIRRVRLRRRH